MPYPNSPTPVTIKLNLLFSTREAGFVSTALRDLKDRRVSMTTLVTRYDVAQGDAGLKHINDWPLCQQWQARDAMWLALTKVLPITFDWQNDSTTSIEIVHFGHSIGITFHSPLSYPPYWGP